MCIPTKSGWAHNFFKAVMAAKGAKFYPRFDNFITPSFTSLSDLKTA